jgi:hypothetical protein
MHQPMARGIQGFEELLRSHRVREGSFLPDFIDRIFSSGVIFHQICEPNPGSPGKFISITQLILGMHAEDISAIYGFVGRNPKRPSLHNEFGIQIFHFFEISLFLAIHEKAPDH